jgi:hypothetical protein
MGVLRPFEKSTGELVQHGRLRQPAEEPAAQSSPPLSSGQLTPGLRPVTTLNA